MTFYSSVASPTLGSMEAESCHARGNPAMVEVIRRSAENLPLPGLTTVRTTPPVPSRKALFHYGLAHRRPAGDISTR